MLWALNDCYMSSAVQPARLEPSARLRARPSGLAPVDLLHLSMLQMVHSYTCDTSVRRLKVDWMRL